MLLKDIRDRVRGLMADKDFPSEQFAGLVECAQHAEHACLRGALSSTPELVEIAADIIRSLRAHDAVRWSESASDLALVEKWLLKQREAEVGEAVFPVDGGGHGELRLVRAHLVDGQTPPSLRNGKSLEATREFRSALHDSVCAARSLSIKLFSSLTDGYSPETDSYSEEHNVRWEILGAHGSSLDGDSVGLAAFIALVSRLSELPVPGHYVFTGALGRTNSTTPWWSIVGVGHLPSKLAITRELGYPIIVAPAGSNLGAGLEASTTADALRLVFGDLNELVIRAEGLGLSRRRMLDVGLQSSARLGLNLEEDPLGAGRPNKPSVSPDTGSRSRLTRGAAPPEVVADSSVRLPSSPSKVGIVTWVAVTGVAAIVLATAGLYSSTVKKFIRAVVSEHLGASSTPSSSSFAHSGPGTSSLPVNPPLPQASIQLFDAAVSASASATVSTGSCCGGGDCPLSENDYHVYFERRGAGDSCKRSEHGPWSCTCRSGWPRVDFPCSRSRELVDKGIRSSVDATGVAREWKLRVADPGWSDGELERFADAVLQFRGYSDVEWRKEVRRVQDVRGGVEPWSLGPTLDTLGPADFESDAKATFHGVTNKGAQVGIVGRSEDYQRYLNNSTFAKAPRFEAALLCTGWDEVLGPDDDPRQPRLRVRIYLEWGAATR